MTDDIRRGTLSNDDAGNIMCGFAVRVPSQIGLKRGTQIAGQNSIYMDLRTEKQNAPFERPDKTTRT